MAAAAGGKKLPHRGRLNKERRMVLEQIIKEHEQLRELLDDCVATCEVYRCMQDKGMEDLDRDSITLAPAKFEQCFPGVAWQPVETEDGPVGISFKTAEYRGFRFWCFSEPRQAEACTG